MGGQQEFTKRLQIVFDSAYYDPGNEPDIAFPFLFNYINGEEWRTQKTVRNLIDQFFNTTHKGIPGNDDTGTMPAWLLFAMMGFYPDCPGSQEYQICSPVFDKISIALDRRYYKGESFVVVAKNNKKDHLFIQSVFLNSEPNHSYQISHNQITKGGKMTFELGKLPKKGVNELKATKSKKK